MVHETDAVRIDADERVVEARLSPWQIAPPPHDLKDRLRLDRRTRRARVIPAAIAALSLLSAVAVWQTMESDRDTARAMAAGGRP